MSHLMADTSDELEDAAEALGLSRWIQYPGTYKEHLDVCESMRTRAIRTLGAQQVDLQFIADLMDKKRAQEPPVVVKRAQAVSSAPC